MDFHPKLNSYVSSSLSCLCPDSLVLPSSYAFVLSPTLVAALWTCTIMFLMIFFTAIHAHILTMMNEAEEEYNFLFKGTIDWIYARVQGLGGYALISFWSLRSLLHR
jgi:hypothetical protein